MASHKILKKKYGLKLYIATDFNLRLMNLDSNVEEVYHLVLYAALVLHPIEYIVLSLS